MGKVREHLKKAIYDTSYIWREELRNVFADMGVIIFFFIVPLAYPIIYGLIYNPEVMHEAKLVVVDNSNTPISRDLIRRIDATPDVHVVFKAVDMVEAKHFVDSKEAYGILYIPSDFNKLLNTNQQAHVSLYADMSSLLFYKAFLMAATDATLEMGHEVKIRRMTGSTAVVEQINSEPIPYETVNMFNPQNGFASFLVPAILILIIQQTLILGVGMLAGTARERNRLGSLVPITHHYAGVLRIVFGRSLSYFTIYLLVCIWILLVVPAIFSLPQISQPGTISLFTLPYLLACILFAMSLSCIVKHRETPMMIFVFTSVPLLFVSGVSWPSTAIPDFWQWVGYIFPSTHGIQGYIKINNMGATLSAVKHEYMVLWIQVGVYFITTCILYRYQLHKTKRTISKRYKDYIMRRKIRKQEESTAV